MRKLLGIAVLMLALMALSVAAGSIDGLDYNDCTDQEPVCVARQDVCHNWGNVCTQYAVTLASCDHWHSGSGPHYYSGFGHCHDSDWNGQQCVHWEWQCTHWHYNECIQYEDQCTESVDSSITDEDVTIHADTSDDGQDALNQIAESSDEWSQDSSGISSGGVVRILSGRYDFRDEFGTYTDYLKTLFAGKDEIDALNNRMDMLQAYIELGPGKTDREYVHAAAMIKAARTGEIQYLPDGYVCTKWDCILITPVAPPESTEAGGDSDLGYTLEERERALALWDSMCARGMQKWCAIARNNRAFWGME
jgi:hypothetical protein